jgi:hypothetical protein
VQGAESEYCVQSVERGVRMQSGEDRESGIASDVASGFGQMKDPVSRRLLIRRLPPRSSPEGECFTSSLRADKVPPMQKRLPIGIDGSSCR